MVGYRVPGYDDPDYYASEILNDVLNSPRGALYDLQASGKALETFAEASTHPAAGMSIVGSAVPITTTGDSAVADVKAVIAGYKKTGLPAGPRRRCESPRAGASAISGELDRWIGIALEPGIGGGTPHARRRASRARKGDRRRRQPRVADLLRQRDRDRRDRDAEGGVGLGVRRTRRGRQQLDAGCKYRVAGVRQERAGAAARARIDGYAERADVAQRAQADRGAERDHAHRRAARPDPQQPRRRSAARQRGRRPDPRRSVRIRHDDLRTIGLPSRTRQDRRRRERRHVVRAQRAFQRRRPRRHLAGRRRVASRAGRRRVRDREATARGSAHGRRAGDPITKRSARWPMPSTRREIRDAAPRRRRRCRA